jgi:hypothetical protein
MIRAFASEREAAKARILSVGSRSTQGLATLRATEGLATE